MWHLCTVWTRCLALLCSPLPSSLLFFLFSARFGTILASCCNPWDLKNTAFSLRDRQFKLVAIFALDAALGPKNHPKTLQISPPSPPKGTPEEPRSAQERPRRAPRASQNHPQRPLRVPLGVQKVSWGGFGSLGASFWSPRG